MKIKKFCRQCAWVLRVRGDYQLARGDFERALVYYDEMAALCWPRRELGVPAAGGGAEAVLPALRPRL